MFYICDLWEVHEQFDFLVLNDGEWTQELKSNFSRTSHKQRKQPD